MNEHGGRRLLGRFDAFKLGWLRDSLFFVAAIAVFIIVFRFVIGLSIVGGRSMDPTLKDGDLVVYSRMTRSYHAGDIVAMRVPSGDFYIKRVAAATRTAEQRTQVTAAMRQTAADSHSA